MTIAGFASITAFCAYGGLLLISLQKKVKGNQTNALFFLYLLDMLLLQVSYIGISLAGSASTALFWYTINIPLSSAQVIIYFFFIRSFLKLKQTKKLFWGSTTIWILTLTLSILFRAKLFTNLYHDPITGMFLPEIGPIAFVLAIPTVFFLGATLFVLARNHKNQRRSQQARIEYLFLSIVIFWVGMTANASTTLQPYAVDVLANILSAGLIAYAIWRYELLELTTIFRKTLETFIHILIFGAGNALALWASLTLFEVNLPIKRVVLIAMLASAGMTLSIPFVFRPLRDRLLRELGNILYKTTYDSHLMVQRISQTSKSIIDLHELAEVFLGDVVKTLQSQWAILFIRQKDEYFESVLWKGTEKNTLFKLNKNHPLINWIRYHQPEMPIYNFNETPRITLPLIPELNAVNLLDSELLPLKSRDELVGLLWLGPNTKKRPYSQDEKNNLIAAANNIAATIDNARLYDELQRELTQRQKDNRTLSEQLEEIKLLQDELRKQAIRDPLTGLFNRRYLFETFERELARAQRDTYPVSVMMLDIDLFKEINDTFGHQAGDDALKSLGHLLEKSVRQGDIVCRYGGDEFIVIMPGSYARDSQRRAETLRKNAAKNFIMASDQKVSITISVGIAIYPEQGNDTYSIIKAADDALYAAKKAGRNIVCIAEKITK